MPDKRYKAIVDGKEEFFDVGENRYDEFISMYPDATLVEDFQTGVTETGASATPEINQAPENGVYDFLNGSLESVESRSLGVIPPNSYVIENPNEEEVVDEYINKRGRKVRKYAVPSQEELLRETINNLDEPEFISNSRGRKVNNPKYVKPENRPSLEVQAQAYIKDNDLDIEFTNNYFNPKGETWFVDKYYSKNKLAMAGLSEAEMKDFQGMLLRDDFIDGFEEDVIDGVYGELGGLAYTGDEKRDIQVAKERTLARKLSQYIAERDSRLNDKTLVQNIIENPSNFDQSKSLDEIKEEAYKNSDIGYTLYDQEALSGYIKETFPELSRKNAENQEKKNEAYLKRKAWNARTNTTDQGAANLGEFIKGLGTGFYKKLDETAIWIDDTIGIFGGNERAKQQRLLNIEDEIADTDSLEYFYATGKGATIDGETYIKDERGNIYNTTEGVNVSQILTPLELKSISQKIDAEGKPMDDFSFRGGAIMGGEVTGGIVFDVIGTKGFGTARVAASAGYLAKANKLRSAKGLKNINTRARGASGRFVSTKETFGVKLPFNAQMLDASMYYSFVGGVTGYENTMKAAMQAGLSNEEAEKLADQAQLEMAVLYGVTTPINPRISFVNKLDDILTKNKIFNTAINEYKKAGNSQLAFSESIKNQIKQTGLTATGKTVAFVKEGAKEFVQENVQQYGEIEIVNERINQSVGMDLMQADYSKQDFINTSILSIAAGGLMGGLSAPGSRVNSNKRLQNLYILSQDLKGAKKRFDRMIDAGRLEQEDANNILEQARAVGQSSSKMPAWMLKTPEQLIQASVVQSKIDEAIKEKNQLAKPMQVDVDNRIKGLEEELVTIREEAANQLVTEETKVIEGIVGTDNVKSFDTAAELVEAISKIKGDQYSLDDMMLDMTSDGFIEQDGVIYINKEVAAKTQAISVASHELLHKVLKSEFKNNPEMKRVVDEFKQILKNKGVFKQIEQRAEMYRQRGIGDVDGADADEYFTFFSDAIAKKEIPFQALEESQWVKIGKAIANLFNTRFGTKNLKFSSGQQVFDFIKDYQAGIEKGKLTSQAKKKLKAGAEVEDTDKKSVTLLNTINNLAPETVKTREDFLNPRVFNKVYESTIGDGAISNYVKSKSTSTEMYENTMDSIRDRLMNYNPATDRKTKTGEPITFGEFIFANTNFAKLDAKKKLALEAEERKRTTSSDTKEAKQIADTSTTTQQVEAPKYKNLVESKVLDTDARAKVEAKIISTTRVLKSRIDAAISKNKTVTPLISEIKKEMGKQADIEFKKMLGVKKDGELRRNYLSLKKPILENMTTTWLMQAMPFAIQKQVDGKFTSDWQGKKIDRETVETDKAGRTSGAEIVRRLPNAVNKVSTEEFLSYMFKDGEVIRGRKESLAKAMAEEYALDVYSIELRNPDSEIRKAFEGNQERLGVELAENFVQEFSRQSERGNVKRSVTLFRQMLDLEIQGDIDGATEIFETLNEAGKQLWLEATSDLRTDNLRYKQALKKLALPKNVSNLLELYFENNSARDNKQAMKEYYEFSLAMIEALPNSLVKALGHDFFGAHYRYMNPAVANSYGAKIKSIIDALPIVDSDITLIQAGFGLVEKITKDVLHKEFKTTQEKVDYFLENYGNQIQALNIANKKAIETIVSTAFDLAIKKPQYAVGFLRMLESTTNIGKSLRALTGISDIQMTAASQAVYINKKTGQGYTNKAKKAKAKEIESGEVVINTKHPNYKEAQQFIKDGSKQTIDQLLRIKGEHATPSSNFNVAIGTELLTALSQALENPGGVGFVKNALIAKINQLSADFNQQLNTKVLSDIQDAKLGSTSDIGDLRLLAIPTESQDAFFDIQGYQTISRVNRLINAMFSSKNVSEFAKIQTQQKALNNARKASYSLNPKGISVYDFDDTLAFSKSQVIVNKDGKTYKITPAEFAKQGETLANEGATFDFSEFSKVVKGTPGPLAPRLKKAIDKFGNKNIFVLTARPADSASSIYTFLKGIGLEIPFENITGLANGAPAAKAAWMIGKVADGYNDFYFVDDHLGNVKAVKDVLDVFDVKGKVQQARVKRSVTLSKEFNEMIARQTGIASEKEFSKVVARRRGKKQGKYKFFLPPSAEDFRGLTQYVFAGKGKQGEADQAFFEQNLMDPYFQGVSAIDQARQTIKNDMKGLLSMFKPVKNKLGKLTPDGDYTFDAAVRVYLWTKAGYEIPGISKRDQNKLNKLVNKDPELSGFADGLLAISKKEKWSEPGEYWDSQTVISDLNNLTEKVNRKEYLAEFIENVDNIFSETNLNKIEALYGKSIRESLEDSIYAMKTGSNRPSGSNGITNRWLNWVNNSVGTIMFFNRRSALLQTISSVNFINWSDNNPAKAAAAFANQPQFWKDFATLFNSDKLKQRRGGLKSDVQEAEIANAAKNTKDKANAIISYLLKIGFTPTQLADSFAIASGGATFYRNRINTYKKQGLSQQEAETKAFSDFSKLSDESQQSGDPALVSSQQRSVAGRLILAFQNTPMQYTRLMKKAAQDLINGRGDAKTHISMILYYGAIQNFIFNALQTALFALIPGFDEEEDDDDKKALAQEKKTVRILNGMVDSVLRGTGMYGAIVSTIKNTYMKYQEQEEKGFTANHAYTIIEAANISPPIGSKLRKVHSAIQTGRFDKDVIEKYPWTVSLDGKLNISPTYSIIGNLASAAINLPLDRAIMEAQGIAEALDVRNTNAQRIALGLGWRTWDVGAKNEEFDLIKTVSKSKRKEQSKKKSKQARETKKQEEKKRVENMTAEEYDAYINAKALKRREAAIKAAETRMKNQ